MFSLVRRLRKHAEDYKEDVLLRETLLYAANEVKTLSILGAFLGGCIVVVLVLTLFL